MLRTWTQAENAITVPGCAITLVLREAVARVQAIQFSHKRVATNLGDDRRCTDRSDFVIAANDRLATETLARDNDFR